MQAPAFPSLSVVSDPLDEELSSIVAKLHHKYLVGGRADVEVLLCRLLADGSTARSLDLIGHSSIDRTLLRLGDWILDPRHHATTAFFRGLADNDVFTRLGTSSLRLFGCETASTPDGRALLRVLAEATGLDVYAAREMLTAADFEASGFRDDRMHALVCSREVENCALLPALQGDPYRRILDLEAIPASPLQARRWPSRIATHEAAAAILRLIRRGDGAYMPGLDPIPSAELCLPSMSRKGWYHTLQVVLDGTFVRTYPDATGPGVLFPISDPDALRALVRELPRLTD